MQYYDFNHSETSKTVQVKQFSITDGARSDNNMNLEKFSDNTSPESVSKKQYPKKAVDDSRLWEDLTSVFRLNSVSGTILNKANTKSITSFQMRKPKLQSIKPPTVNKKISKEKCKNQVSRYTESFNLGMNKKKFKPLSALIEKNQQMYAKGEYCYIEDELFINKKKKFQVKAFEDQKLYKYYNPCKMLRLLDYICPIDSSFLNYQDINSDCKEIDIIGNIMDFKRVYNIVYNLKEETYTYNIEEKWPNKLKMKGYENFRYIVQYLLSLGNKNAFKLSEIISKYIDSIYDHEKMVSSCYDQDGEVCADKVWMKKLTSGTMKFIESQPFMIRTHCYDLSSGNGMNQSVIINKHFADLTGINSELYENKNCEFMSLFRSKNWVSWATKSILLRDMNNRYDDDEIEPPDVVTTEEDIYLKNVNEEIIPGLIVLYKEKWSQLNCIFSKTYVVFIQKN